LKQERRVTFQGPPDPLAGSLDSQNRLSVTFYTCKSKDLKSCLALKVLLSLLMEGAASPMYKALIESHLGSEFSVNSGFDDSTP
jgi:Zn-dependent M16 (insulinase) family peptidase